MVRGDCPTLTETNGYLNTFYPGSRSYGAGGRRGAKRWTRRKYRSASGNAPSVAGYVRGKSVRSTTSFLRVPAPRR